MTHDIRRVNILFRKFTPLPLPSLGKSSNFGIRHSLNGLKYSMNLPIILVFKVWTEITHGVSRYTWCGFCKPVFSKGYAHIQVDSMNTLFALLINPPRHFVFKLSKNESSNLRVFRPTPRHWMDRVGGGDLSVKFGTHNISYSNKLKPVV